MTRIQEQLRNQSLDDILSSAFKQVGGVVYPDAASNSNLKSLKSIVDSWRAVHAPTYATLIPSTATKISHSVTIVDAFETVFNPSENQVIQVQGFEIINSSVAPVQYYVGCGDVSAYYGTIDPTATVIVPLEKLPLFSHNVGALSFNQKDGSVGDLSINIVYSSLVV